MKHISLGGLDVSRIGLGTMAMSGYYLVELLHIDVMAVHPAAQMPKRRQRPTESRSRAHGQAPAA